MLEQYDDVISVKELCEILRIGRNRAYELLQTNQIKGFQMGRPWKVPKVAVEEFLKNNSILKESYKVQKEDSINYFFEEINHN